MIHGKLVISSGFYLVAKPVDRYPGDDDGGISDFGAERRSISHLGSWEDDMGNKKFNSFLIIYVNNNVLSL